MVSHIICCFKRYSVAKTDLADPSQVPCDLSRDIYVLACPRVMAAATWRVDRSTKQACVHFLLLTSSAQFIINLLLNRLLNQTVVTSSIRLFSDWLTHGPLLTGQVYLLVRCSEATDLFFGCPSLYGDVKTFMNSGF